MTPRALSASIRPRAPVATSSRSTTPVVPMRTEKSRVRRVIDGRWVSSLKVSPLESMPGGRAPMADFIGGTLRSGGCQVPPGGGRAAPGSRLHGKLLKIDNFILTIGKAGRIRSAYSIGLNSGMNKSLLFLGSAMLAACATSPDPAERFIGDHEALVETVPGAPAEWAAQGVAGKAPTGDWLSQFNDPVMEALVAEALAANPTLESRAALTRAPEALTRSARGARLPSLSASATA